MSEVLEAIMLERMAKAMMEVPADAPPGRSPAWHYWVPDARAVLKALREPTEAMIAAIAQTFGYDRGDVEIHFGVRLWRAMIDAALAEAEKLP